MTVTEVVSDLQLSRKMTASIDLQYDPCYQSRKTMGHDREKWQIRKKGKAEAIDQGSRKEERECSTIRGKIEIQFDLK